MVEGAPANNESQLWVMAVIAFAVVYSNYMVAPLIPALSHEFSVSPYQLGWLITLSFATALAVFASAQTLFGFAALCGFRAERPGCMELIRMARTRLASSLRQADATASVNLSAIEG
jgi:hypothetical protein